VFRCRARIYLCPNHSVVWFTLCPREPCRESVLRYRLTESSFNNEHTQYNHGRLDRDWCIRGSFIYSRRNLMCLAKNYARRCTIAWSRRVSNEEAQLRRCWQVWDAAHASATCRQHVIFTGAELNRFATPRLTFTRPGHGSIDLGKRPWNCMKLTNKTGKWQGL
jgi:hypothetical protein